MIGADREAISTLLDSTPHAIIRVDRELRHLYANKTIERMTGFALERFLGKTPGELGMPADLIDLWGRTVRGIFDTGEPAIIEFPFPRSNGVTYCEARYIPEFTEDDSVKSVLCLVRDVTERKNLERQLRLIQFSVDAACEGIFWFDPEGRIVRVNPTSCHLTGYSEEELLRMTVAELSGRYTPEAWSARWRELKEAKHLMYESRHICKDGHEQPAEVSLAYFEFEGAEYGVGFARDITRRKNLERQIRLTQFSVDTACEGILWFNPEGRILRVNPASCRMTGYSEEELLRMTIAELTARYTPETWSGRWLELKEAKHSMFESRHLCKDGRELQTEVWVVNLEFEGTEYGVAFWRDITQRKSLEKTLVAKQTLLREVHHRIKNNLQIISSLMRLQERALEHGDPAVLMREARQRVESIALLHEQLCESEDPTHIDLVSYAKRLVGRLEATAMNGIKFTMDLAPVMLDSRDCVLFGLILNELVTNCLNHAFPNGRHGTISIRSTVAQKRLVLVVSDDGVGVPGFSEATLGERLGLKLVRRLTSQLKGSVVFSSQAGFTAQIEFPIEESR